MVTGGGGSIGSELCRQIAAHSPKQLVIVEIYENSAYDIQNELKEIINNAIDNYRKIVKDPQMYLFDKVIMSERSINSSAAEIMVRETKTMINATKTLFYALQVKGIADFENVDSAAVSFAMAVNSLLDYECDLDNAGMKKYEKMMQDFIDEFCRIYGKRR